MRAFTLALMLCLTGTTAQANCQMECSVVSCGGGDVNRDSCMDSCLGNCVDPPEEEQSSPEHYAEPLHVYGAIAFSKATLVSGSSKDASSPDEAEQEALRYCERSPQEPRDCAVVLSFYDSCAAFALTSRQTESNRWGVDRGNSLREAEEGALHFCGAKDCTINYSFCNP